MAAAINESAILPDTIRPNVFTNLAWDNVDRLEETLTGGGPSHRVNGIVVQPKVYGPCLLKPSLPGIRKQKQRSITQEEREKMLSTKLKQTSLRKRTSYGNLRETSVIMARDKRHQVGQALTSRHEIMLIHPNMSWATYPQ